MEPLPVEKRVPGQRVKWSYLSRDHGEIWYSGVIIPIPEGHPLKEIHERDRDLIYVMPDIDLYHWLQGYPFAFWDFRIMNGFGFESPLCAEE
jgi:hypothetical protein